MAEDGAFVLIRSSVVVVVTKWDVGQVCLKMPLNMLKPMARLLYLCGAEMAGEAMSVPSLDVLMRWLGKEVCFLMILCRRDAQWPLC